MKHCSARNRHSRNSCSSSIPRGDEGSIWLSWEVILGNEVQAQPKMNSPMLSALKSEIGDVYAKRKLVFLVML